MDKVFSTRLDEAVLDELERAIRRLGVTKKQFVEDAIQARVAELKQEGSDVWSESCGAWKRRERPQTTVRRTRKAFDQSMQRHRSR